jgi:hypothetical protein
MESNIEVILSLFVYCIILYVWIPMNLFVVLQFNVSKKYQDGKYKQNNFIMKAMAIGWTYFFIRCGALKDAFLYLSSSASIYQNKRIQLLSAIGIVLFEIFALIIVEYENITSNVIYRFSHLRHILLTIQISLAALLLIHMLLKCFNVFDFGTTTWNIELVLNFCVLICIVIASSINLKISSKKEYLCINNGLTQAMFFIDDSHQLKFKKNEDGSYYVSNGEDGADTFVLSINQFKELQKYMGGELI